MTTTPSAEDVLKHMTDYVLRAETSSDVVTSRRVDGRTVIAGPMRGGTLPVTVVEPLKGVEIILGYSYDKRGS